MQFEGPTSIAAIVLETVPGTAGIMVPPKGFLQGVRAICDRYGILYVADEVMCGFGRTGAWFAYQQHDVAPDLVVFAKGVNSGYVPLGGVVISESGQRHLQRPGLPRRSHLFGTPARLRGRGRDDRSNAGRGDRRERPPDRR